MEELLHGLLVCHGFDEAAELHRAQHERLLPVPDVAPGPRAVRGLRADRRKLQHQSAWPARKQPATSRNWREVTKLAAECEWLLSAPDAAPGAHAPEGIRAAVCGEASYSIRPPGLYELSVL